MTLDLVVWLLAMFMQSGLLGMTMYTLICLTDLENDYINPHDASARVNKWVIPEVVLQCTFAGILLVGGKWIAGMLPLGLAAWCIRSFTKGTAYTDVTEIFKQVSEEKKNRFIKLGVHLFMFVLTIYRLVNAAVHGLLTDEAKEVAKRLLQDSIGSPY
ncbi:hypothetical protein BSKO_12935 [Bryopsis sp. KO-2023]|nr:hypothetical protein BSKO_12935 [Bryopsis sp. KO-2023]